MKIKSLMIAMIASVAVVLGTSSCSSNNDDEPEAPVATQVAGSYTGTETLTVMGDAEESSETIEFTKATDVSIDVTLPEYGEGMMTIPALPVKGITLTKSGNTITGKLKEYKDKIKNAKGVEKDYLVTNVTVIFSDKTVAMTFTLHYGSMPNDFEGQFTGTRK